MAPLTEVLRYVRDILTNTSKDLETVTIEPNGRWLTKASQDEDLKSSTGTTYEEDDDFEISEISVIGRRLDTPKPCTPVTGTPASAGRDSSASAPRGAATFSAKRPAAAVIDLTLSSDDEEPIRPRKRQNTSANGFRDDLDFWHDSPHNYHLS